MYKETKRTLTILRGRIHELFDDLYETGEFTAFTLEHLEKDISKEISDLLSDEENDD